MRKKLAYRTMNETISPDCQTSSDNKSSCRSVTFGSSPKSAHASYRPPLLCVTPRRHVVATGVDEHADAQLHQSCCIGGSVVQWQNAPSPRQALASPPGVSSRTTSSSTTGDLQQLTSSTNTQTVYTAVLCESSSKSSSLSLTHSAPHASVS